MWGMLAITLCTHERQADFCSRTSLKYYLSNVHCSQSCAIVGVRDTWSSHRCRQEI